MKQTSRRGLGGGAGVIIRIRIAVVISLHREGRGDLAHLMSVRANGEVGLQELEVLECPGLPCCERLAGLAGLLFLGEATKKSPPGGVPGVDGCS